MGQSYKGYRVGSIEKNVLQILLGVKDVELPQHGCGPTFSNIFETARQKRNFSIVVKNLIKKKLVASLWVNGSLTIALTEKGKATLDKLMLGEANTPLVPEKWDGYWRVVIFDVPQAKREVRDMLRTHLKRLGFKQIQASVWAYPFPCEYVVTLIKTRFNLGEEVLYMKVEFLEGDVRLKTLFKVTAPT